MHRPSDRRLEPKLPAAKPAPALSARAQLVEQGLVTVREAADFLGISRSTLHRLMAEGVLPFAKIRAGRRVPRAALRAFAAASMRSADA